MSDWAWVMITLMSCTTLIICVLAVCATVKSTYEDDEE